MGSRRGGQNRCALSAHHVGRVAGSRSADAYCMAVPCGSKIAPAHGRSRGLYLHDCALLDGRPDDQIADARFVLEGHEEVARKLKLPDSIVHGLAR
jgi:hypothetical protein